MKIYLCLNGHKFHENGEITLKTNGVIPIKYFTNFVKMVEPISKIYEKTPLNILPTL